MAFKMKGFPLQKNVLPTKDVLPNGDGDPKRRPNVSERYLSSDGYQAKEVKKLRDELGIPDVPNSAATDPLRVRKGPSRQDYQFVKTTNGAGDNALDKIANLPEEEYEEFKGEIKETVKPFVGVRGSGLGVAKIIDEVRKLDLSVYKKYIDSAGISMSDIRNVISINLANLPDNDKAGGPDIFEGFKGKALKLLVDKVVDMKLKGLEDGE